MQTLAQVEDRDGVEPVERLVEDHEGVATRERRSDGDPLSHARRAVADPAIEQQGQAQRFMQLSQAGADIIDAPGDEFENVASTQGIRQGSVEGSRVSARKRRLGDDKTPHSTTLTEAEEAMVVAFQRHTLLPLDDCLYALQPLIPHLTRSALHRCLERHGIYRLPDIEGDKPKRQRFKRCPIRRDSALGYISPAQFERMASRRANASPHKQGKSSLPTRAVVV